MGGRHFETETLRAPRCLAGKHGKMLRAEGCDGAVVSGVLGRPKKARQAGA